jgi:hypothetical protein
MTVAFQGTEDETQALLAATEHSCAPPEPCIKDVQGKVTRICAAHRALLDQKFLDGVLFERRRRDELLAEEWRP